MACTDPYLSGGAALQAWMNCMPGKSPHLGTCPYTELAFPGPQGLQGGILQRTASLPQTPAPTQKPDSSPSLLQPHPIFPTLPLSPLTVP